MNAAQAADLGDAPQESPKSESLTGCCSRSAGEMPNQGDDEQD